MSNGFIAETDLRILRMKEILCILAALLSISMTSIAGNVSLDLKSTYIETISNNDTTRDVVADYGMKSDDNVDQSMKLQRAINDIAKIGGGSLVIPKGTYRFLNVYMASNVHILVDKNAILKPFFSKPDKGGVMLHFNPQDESSSEYVENCSIRCLQRGKTYKVDYSEYTAHQQVRFVILRMAKNFMVADVDIYDNFTNHCGIVFVPSNTEGADQWKLSRPTDGEIRDCSIFNAKTGYGLCQLHGAQTIFFENIYSNGGVTLRLESGAGGPYAGVFDISARNVISENGRSAVMMNPHATVNGTVKVDGVLSKGSGIAVLVHAGFVDRKHKYIPGAKPGIYASDSEIINIKAIYGENGQANEKQIYACPPIDEEYKKFKMNHYGDPKAFISPSLLPVLDCTNGRYKVTYKNIVSKGFPLKCDGVVYENSIEDRKKRNNEILAALPVMQNLSESERVQYYAAKNKKAKEQAEQDKERMAVAKDKGFL